MFIIFGTTTISRAVDGGQFYCPHCRMTRTYAKKVATRYFTLFFIPLIPLDTVAEFVECADCGEAYRMAVLDLAKNPPELSPKDTVNGLLRDVLCAMASAGGAVDERRAEAARGVCQRTTGYEPTDEDLERAAQADELEMPAWAVELMEYGWAFPHHLKVAFVKFALFVAHADGVLDRSEWSVLAKLCAGMGLGERQLRAIIEPPFPQLEPVVH